MKNVFIVLNTQHSFTAAVDLHSHHNHIVLVRAEAFDLQDDIDILVARIVLVALVDNLLDDGIHVVDSLLDLVFPEADKDLDLEEDMIVKRVVDSRLGPDVEDWMMY